MDNNIIKNMGTNLSELAYKKLCGSGKDYELTENEAKIKVNEEFGFETSKIKIVTFVESFYKEGNCAKSCGKVKRLPQYCASDYNYIRFDVNGWQYEMINGTLNEYLS